MHHSTKILPKLMQLFNAFSFKIYFTADELTIK